MEYVLGLDWAGQRSWACCQLWINSKRPPRVHRLQVEDGQLLEMSAGAATVVVDAPIGLPECAKSAQLRPCDYGARAWVGPALRETIQAVVTQHELDQWRDVSVKRRGGHLRGLLPAISSVDRLLGQGVELLESHPELVYAALSGQQPPRTLKKTTLRGVLTRLDLLRRHNLDLADADESGHLLSAIDLLDAGAMALVALGWWRMREGVQVIRSEAGDPEPLAQGSQKNLMTLPEGAIDSRRRRSQVAH